MRNPSQMLHLVQTMRCFMVYAFWHRLQLPALYQRSSCFSVSDCWLQGLGLYSKVEKNVMKGCNNLMEIQRQQTKPSQPPRNWKFICEVRNPDCSLCLKKSHLISISASSLSTCFLSFQLAHFGQSNHSGQLSANFLTRSMYLLFKFSRKSSG